MTWACRAAWLCWAGFGGWVLAMAIMKVWG